MAYVRAKANTNVPVRRSCIIERARVHTDTKKWNGIERNAREFNGVEYNQTQPSCSIQINNNAIWNRKIYPKGTVYVHSIFTRTHAQNAINAATISTQAHTSSRSDARNVLGKSPSIVSSAEQFSSLIFCFVSHKITYHLFRIRSHFVCHHFHGTKYFYIQREIVFVCVSFTKSQIQFHKSKSNFHLTQTLAHTQLVLYFCFLRL